MSVHLFLSAMTLAGMQAADGTSPPLPVRLVFIDEQRALDEFDTACLKPMFDQAAVQKAVSASSIRYVAEDPFASADLRQQRWTAPEAILTLSLPNGPKQPILNMPQCELNMVSRASHPAQDVLRKMTDRLANRFKGPFVIEQGDRAVTWPSERPGVTYRLELITDTDPTQSLDLIVGAFDEVGRQLLKTMQERARP